MKTSSKARLVRKGQRIDGPEFGLSDRHIFNLERLAVEPEAMLGRSTIADEFEASFFETNFWLMWCTTFAFQPWHSAVEFKRYLVHGSAREHKQFREAAFFAASNRTIVSSASRRNPRQSPRYNFHNRGVRPKRGSLRRSRARLSVVFWPREVARSRIP